MRRMIWLTQDAGKVLVNPDHIEAVFRRDIGGSYIYFNSEDDALIVKESPEEIDRLVSLG